jgi:hypothetical protein
MGHALLRSWQLRAAVLCIAVFSFAAIAATAEATTTTSHSVGAVCTTNPGSCNFSGNSSATFAGRFQAPAVIFDPLLCGNQAADPTDTLCGHFGIDTTNQQGVITVVINFDPGDDLDLCVIDSLGQQVAPCSAQGSGSSEIVTFNVACGDTHFEAQIFPFLFGSFPGPTPLDPSEYTGSVTASLTSCLTGGNGGGGNGNPGPPSASGGRKMTGGGQISTASFNNNIIQESDGLTYKGKVAFATSSCDFRSTSIDSAEWDDAAQAVVVHGRGTVKGVSGTVAFTVRLDDNGEAGRGDLYNMQSFCSGNGNVQSGNLQYHLP